VFDMSIFNKISENEQEMIANYIEAYAGYDRESISMKAPLSHILRFWEHNKVDLFNVFGGEILLTKKVSFNKPECMIEDDISAMINGVGYPFYHSFNRWVDYSYKGDNSYELRSLLWCSNLASNTWLDDGFVIPTEDGHSIAVNKGCKISKVLGKIARAFNLESYEEFRIAHSQCLNQKKLSGELCISIHPLDYMTMSDNDSGWSSCMSWEDTGDYRQGTVEMMNSPCIVVAYLKGSENMRMPFGDEWNNKKWRCLYIVTPHIITGIREYPYENPELNGTVLQWLRELAMANTTTWGPYHDTVTSVRNNADITVANMGREIRLNFYTNIMYNDFYAIRPAYLADTIPDFYELCFSGETECMECGADMSYDCHDGMSNALLCDDCDNSIWCAECGERVSRDESVCINGSYYCEYCYENHFAGCDCCEETFHENDIEQVYLRYNGEVTCYHISVCYDCLNSETFTQRFGNTAQVPHGRWNTRTVVDVENFAKDMLDYFDIWHPEDFERYSECINTKASAEN
jgi:hypothetical protein